MKSIAFVVPRYGADIGGGAETLVRQLVLNAFSGQHLESLGFRSVEVWTTCAKDHRTWENCLEPGTEIEDGITIRRFSVDPRSLDSFIRFEHAMQEGRALTLGEQLKWLENGVNSSSLYQHIASAGAEFDYIVFAPYLFPTSFWGSLIHPSKSILIPCLHDEHYAYLDSFRCVFSKVRGLFFNAVPEKELAETVYNLPAMERKSAVVGMGFSIPADPEVETKASRDYILYTGRKETGKGLDILISCFESYRKQHSHAPLELRIIGSGNIEFLESLPPGVRDLGYVSEDEKLSLMRGALALCQPSVNESFSIVLMESWLERTPVIVNSQCAVTRYHVHESGGGLSFFDEKSFADALEFLLSSNKAVIEMGEKGRDYVEKNYSWPVIRRRLQQAFQQLERLDEPGASEKPNQSIAKSRAANERQAS